MTSEPTPKKDLSHLTNPFSFSGEATPLSVGVQSLFLPNDSKQEINVRIFVDGHQEQFGVSPVSLGILKLGITLKELKADLVNRLNSVNDLLEHTQTIVNKLQIFLRGLDQWEQLVKTSTDNTSDAT